MFQLYLTYLVPRPHTVGDQWRSILLPFQANLWLGVIVAVILMSIIHWKLSCIKFNTGLDDNAISIILIINQIILKFIDLSFVMRSKM